MTINIFNRDCMDAMKEMNDNAFDLAIVDPPYGININTQYKSGFLKCDAPARAIEKEWDSSIPSPEYFDELKRVSRFQIIWGGNYFLDYLSNTRCLLVWDKNNGNNFMADCEIAWTNLDSAVRKFTYHHLEGSGANNSTGRIHPTQKPVRLYEWILDKYAKPNWKILDTHIGSGSIAVACHNCGFDLTGFEIDSDYYNDCMKRLNEHQRQLKLWN